MQPYGFLSSLAYLPVPFELPSTPKIGDCGAWSYKLELVPKLKRHLVTPEWALEQYKLYFSPGDLVVAPDHMLIPFEGVDLDDRRRFNTASAKAFLPIAQAAGFNPMATVHGMDTAERLEHISKLVEMGYKHFSFGGLAARAGQKRQCLETVQILSERVRSLVPDAWIHVLGLSSPDYAAAWQQMGIDSFDGSSHFKQAFTAGTFFSHDGSGKLTKHQAARPTNNELITAPTCDCLACSRMREEGIDTCSYGSNENNMGRAAHNLNMLMQAHAVVMSQPTIAAPIISVGKSNRTIVLISCVGKKLSSPAPAKKLYRSQWFLKARQHVEAQKSDWYILSALYGLVHRDTEIEPYEKTLNTMPSVERRVWAAQTFDQILRVLPDGGTVQIYAGDRYREYLVPLLQSAGYVIKIPLQGLGIGQQLQWFDAQRITQLTLL